MLKFNVQLVAALMVFHVQGAAEAALSLCSGMLKTNPTMRLQLRKAASAGGL
jgi:hypothetical protein